MTDLVLTAPAFDSAKSLAQRITEYVAMKAPPGSPPDALAKGEMFIADFIATTTFAPALEGEPIFVLRAQDKIAPSQLLNWADDADRHMSHQKANGARDIAHEMIAWQMAHPSRVKAPD